MAAHNIIDYVEAELRGMSELEFNAVDSLVFSQLSYIYFDGIVPAADKKAKPVRISELLKAELFPSMFHNVRDKDSNRRLVFALAASPRFRNIRMNWYVDNVDSVQEKQFSAITFLLDDDTAYIAFRGTDATFIGWKEDFNMAYITPVPAQEESVRYLHMVFRRAGRGRMLRLGGHSKGGNLAVYAAMKCSPAVQSRLLTVYDHDGPGFTQDVFTTQGYLRVQDRIRKTLPQSSIVGMLLQHRENYSVVESNRFGIMQHDPFSWTVESGDFIYVENVTNGALHLNRAITQWIGLLDEEKRKAFVETLYQVVMAADAATVFDFAENWRNGAAAMLSAIKNVDPETRKNLTQTLNELMLMAVRNAKKNRPLLFRPARKSGALPQST